MDPLTHGLLGAATAHALLGGRLRHAWMIGAVAGLAPDLDVLIRSEADPLLVIEHHRGFTHALAFIPAGGAVAALPWLATPAGRARWRTVAAAALAGYATHGLLDACTTYGTRLLWPFSDLRVSWSWISIIDPVFSLFLLGGMVAVAARGGRRPAALALATCALYLATGAAQRGRALTAQATIAESRSHAPDRGEAFPTLGNHLVWRSLYRAGDSLYVDRIRVPWIGAPRWTPGSVVAAGGEGDLTEAERRDPRVRRDLRRFRWFSNGWVARMPEEGDLWADARYSLRTDAFDPIWGVRFSPGERVPTRWVDRTGERSLGLGDLWREVAGTGSRYRPLPP
jgi:inner membrane protein